MPVYVPIEISIPDPGDPNRGKHIYQFDYRLGAHRAHLILERYAYWSIMTPHGGWMQREFYVLRGYGHEDGRRIGVDEVPRIAGLEEKLRAELSKVLARLTDKAEGAPLVWLEPKTKQVPFSDQAIAKSARPFL